MLLEPDDPLLEKLEPELELPDEPLDDDMLEDDMLDDERLLLLDEPSNVVGLAMRTMHHAMLGVSRSSRGWTHSRNAAPVRALRRKPGLPLAMSAKRSVSSTIFTRTQVTPSITARPIAPCGIGSSSTANRPL